MNAFSQKLTIDLKTMKGYCKKISFFGNFLFLSFKRFVSKEVSEYLETQQQPNLEKDFSTFGNFEEVSVSELKQFRNFLFAKRSLLLEWIFSMKSKEKKSTTKSNFEEISETFSPFSRKYFFRAFFLRKLHFSSSISFEWFQLDSKRRRRFRKRYFREKFFEEEKFCMLYFTFAASIDRMSFSVTRRKSPRWYMKIELSFIKGNFVNFFFFFFRTVTESDFGGTEKCFGSLERKLFFRTRKPKTKFWKFNEISTKRRNDSKR